MENFQNHPLWMIFIFRRKEGERPAAHGESKNPTQKRAVPKDSASSVR